MQLQLHFLIAPKFELHRPPHGFEMACSRQQHGNYGIDFRSGLMFQRRSVAGTCFIHREVKGYCHRGISFSFKFFVIFRSLIDFQRVSEICRTDVLMQKGPERSENFYKFLRSSWSHSPCGCYPFTFHQSMADNVIWQHKKAPRHVVLMATESTSVTRLRCFEWCNSSWQSSDLRLISIGIGDSLHIPF